MTACLSVNLCNADCFFQGFGSCKAQDVAEYLADTTHILYKQGYHTVYYCLDHATTHHQKMRNHYTQLTQDIPVQTIFQYFPVYSPQLNVVEYMIHLVRQKYLHHADCKQDMIEVEWNLRQAIHKQKFLTQDQIINILQHTQDFAFK